MGELEQVAERRARWIAVVNARDVDGYVALLADDGVWIPPGLAGVRGREAFRAWVQPFFERFEYEFTVAQAEVRVAGDWAVERGVFTSTLQPRDGGEESTHSGVYVLLWRRAEDGQWYIERYADVTGMLRPTD